MRRFLNLFFSLGLGAIAGAFLVTFFSPVTSAELRENWQQHYRRALAAGRRASAERRSELERELSDLRDA